MCRSYMCVYLWRSEVNTERFHQLLFTTFTELVSAESRADLEGLVWLARVLRETHVSASLLSEG